MPERKTRESETREKTSRKKTWQRPTSLPSPEPRQGIVHRWVRTATLGTSDAKNVSSKFREGWEPVPADEYPEFNDFISEDGDHIEVGGLILCRTDESVMKEREEHYSNVAAQQMESVDQNFFRENDARMPLLQPDRQTTVKFGRGAKDR